MINMMKADLYRMSKSKGMLFFWLFTAFTYSISIISKSYGGITLYAMYDLPETAKTDMGQLTMNATFYFLLIIPVFCVVTSEFGERTLKNTISSSVSKRLYFVSKFLFSLVYSALSFTLANFAYYAVNRLVNGGEYSSAIGDFSKAFFTQFPIFTAIISVFTMFAFLLRRGAIYNAVTISAPIVGTMIAQVLMSINSERESLKKLANFGEKLMSYGVETMSARIIFDTSDDYRTNCYIICAVVTVLSFVIGYISFSKRELD